MMKFISCLRQRLRPGFGSEPSTSAAPILQLPTEILLIITENLALYNQFALSQTCRRMRNSLSYDWSRIIGELEVSVKLELLSDIAYFRREHWVCASCCKLHRFSRFDKPGWPSRSSCRGDFGLCNPASMDSSPGSPTIFHRHVQAALKYHLQGINRRRVDMLLAPWTVNAGSFPSYAAWPKITEGHFLIYEEWVCNYPYEIGKTKPSPCPHIGYYDPDGDLDHASMRALRASNFGRMMFEIWDSCIDSTQWIYRSCRHCSTDFAVRLSFLNGRWRIIITTWRDLGRYESPQNMTWRSQTRKRDENDTRTAYHTRELGRGKIRDMYMKAKH